MDLCSSDDRVPAARAGDKVVSAAVFQILKRFNLDFEFRGVCDAKCFQKFALLGW